MGLDPYLEHMLNRGPSAWELEVAKLNQMLNETPPIVFVPDGPDSGLRGTGYWRVETGVICYRRDAQGNWEPNVTTYTEEEIKRFHLLLNQPPQQF